jgi:hypothetical protein
VPRSTLAPVLPTLGQMTQISRPFQIALVAFALFVAVWFVALRGHSSDSTGGSGSSASAPSAPATPSAAAEAKAAAAPTPIYHGAAPGVEGLTRAINKAHGAVAQSQSDANHFEHAEPSGSTAAPTTSASPATSTSSTVTVKRSASTSTHHTTVVATTTVTKHAPSAAKPAAAVPSMQQAVERELSQHKTVLILFWNPRGSDDVAVHRELPAVQHALGGKIAVHYASASQVGAFGTITHTVQVTQTPTLLIVGSHGQTTTLTGLTDAFSIEQAISEARHS